ncbi:MAG: FAD:protein FMN transferase [Halothermotrichaceae bacterium]
MKYLLKNKKNIIWLIFFVIIIVIFTSCQQQNDENIDLSKLPQENRTTFAMNTLIKMKAYGENAEEVVDKSFARLNEIEDEMSKTVKSSDIYKINQNPQQFIKVDNDTFTVIKKALEYAELTDGKFDPTIGSLVDLWGIGTEKARVPSEEEIIKTKKLVNYQWVRLDKNEKSVKILKPGMKLDLGAIAKGYAADEVRNIIQGYNIDSAYISLGGNVSVVGNKPDGSNWNVGIQDPRLNKAGAMASIGVKNKTIVTSGNYERYFKENGNIYHHIINPISGYPARSDVIGVTIVTLDSFDADALSTSVFILGLTEGMELIENTEGVEGIIINKDLELFLSSGIKDKVQILDSEFEINKSKF